MLIEQLEDTVKFHINFEIDKKTFQDYMDGKMYGLDFEAELHLAYHKVIDQELRDELIYQGNKNKYAMFEDGWLKRQIERAAKEMEHWTESKKKAMRLTR
jgi:hypothetical protein